MAGSSSVLSRLLLRCDSVRWPRPAATGARSKTIQTVQLQISAQPKFNVPAMFRAANIQYMQCPKRRASDSGLAVAVRRAPLTPRFPRRSRHGSAVAAAGCKGLKILKEVRRKL